MDCEDAFDRFIDVLVNLFLAYVEEDAVAD